MGEIDAVDPLEANAGEIRSTRGDMLECLNCNRADLVARYQSALGMTMFSNRTEFRPANRAAIIEHKMQSLAQFLNAPGASARGMGSELERSGLSQETVHALDRARREFYKRHFTENAAVVEIVADYSADILDGFYLEREKTIQREQEGIRRAFEISLQSANEKIRDAQGQAQFAVEQSYLKIIMAQEEERRSIARELHDEAGQALIGISMGMNKLLAELPELEEEKREQIRHAIYWSDHALSGIRALTYRLRPPMLDMLGIQAALKQLCMEFSGETGLNIHYSGVKLPAISDELSISLYRLAQAALTNVVRHAHAKNAWVRLNLKNDMVILSIKDDGMGFDPYSTPAGIGLNGMEERLSLLKGEMTLETAPGKSTLIVFKLPITPGENFTGKSKIKTIQ